MYLSLDVISNGTKHLFKTCQITILYVRAYILMNTVFFSLPLVNIYMSIHRLAVIDWLEP